MSRQLLINVICSLAYVLIGHSVSDAALSATLGQPVALAAQGRYASAAWSPAGGGLALGGERGRGLYYSDMSGTTSAISQSPLAGWGFNWSPDGQSIAYRASDGAGGVAMMVTDEKGKERQLTPFMDGRFQPVWTKDGLTYKAGDEMVTVDAKGKIKSTRSLSQGKGLLTRIMCITGSMMAAHVTGATLTPLTSLIPQKTASSGKVSKQVMVDAESKAWVVDENGNQTKLIDIAGVQGYAAPVASPEEGKYAVRGFDGNLYVADTNGGSPVSLGAGGSPTWSPDGQYVIYARATDDGARLTSSELWISSADGSWKSQLTSDGTIKESPTWSPDGKSIAYIVNGVVYVAPIGM